MILICVNGGRAVKYVVSLSYRRIEKDTIHHIMQKVPQISVESLSS